LVPTTGTITITPPNGTQDGTTNTYKIYKVFDAVASADGSKISYKLVSGKTTAPAGFTVDTAGNVTLTRTTGDLTQLTADEIAAISSYVTETDLVDTATSTGTTAAVSKELPNGYYYITTSTGTVVTIDSTKPNASVQDKNTVPTVNKKVTGVDAGSYDTDGKKALAQVGTKVTYTATVTLGNGSKNTVFHDIMEAGLQYNGDAKVTGVTGATVNNTPDEGDTLTITFADGTTGNATITYSATITSDALQTDPLHNTAKVTYGDPSKYATSETSGTDVYNAKFTVTKKDGEGNPLAGAGFVVKNADGKYYKFTAATETTAATVTWVDSIDDATEYTSDAEGKVTAFTGLADGTYTLVEKTVPAGYNKAADSTFTITAHNYEASNLVQSAEVTNVAGSTLPSTGGIGTTIFYIGGLALVAAAGVMLARRKRA